MEFTMDAKLGIRTTTGDKIFFHVTYFSMHDGFLTINYREQGIDKKAIFEMEYITYFAIG